MVNTAVRGCRAGKAPVIAALKTHLRTRKNPMSGFVTFWRVWPVSFCRFVADGISFFKDKTSSYRKKLFNT
jgi:hypothetical protein